MTMLLMALLLLPCSGNKDPDTRQCENDNCEEEEVEKQHNVYIKEENEKTEQATVEKEGDSNNDDKAAPVSGDGKEKSTEITKKKKRLA